MKKKLIIEGMSCNHCVMHVKNALMELEGIRDVDVNLQGKYAIVEGENLEEKKLKELIEDVGYDLINVENI